jgi:hypothetical protein
MAIAALVALALDACSLSAAPTTTTAAPTTTATTKPSGPTKAQPAAKFLALAAPVNAAADKLPTNITNTSQLQPMVGPLTTFDNAVLRIGLTGQAATDARALVTADKAVLFDIATSDGTDVPRDLRATDSAGNALRADLGSPPA